jgi:hypothetical protein
MSRLPQLNQLIAVQCTLFEKSAARNWLVSPHQDLSLPISTRSAAGRVAPDGQRVVRSDAVTLASCVALRLHLDPCGGSDAALRMVRGSHRNGVLSSAELSICTAQVRYELQSARPGDAWLMSPLLVRSSRKSTGVSRRRVLHFTFAPLKMEN